MDIPFVRLAEVEIDESAARLLGHEYALRFLALPVASEGDFLKVALCEPLDIRIVSDIMDITGKNVLPLAAEIEDLQFYINKIFAGEELEEIETRFLRLHEGRSDAEVSDEFAAVVSAAPAVRLLDSLIESAVLARASDIHIEPFGDKLRARFRIDGKLVTHKTVDISLRPSVVSRLKILGGMDISETRLPQDGSFTKDVGGREIDLRVSTLPTSGGEKAVIRLLRKIRLKKNQLGFYPDDLYTLTKLFARPYGAIFMTGPTGSGKSTTLNCFLEEMNDEAKNIITVEDPVENPIPGISHVSAERNLSFAAALRHILRQDPDVIMIGEIRDEETARIAIRAAITGHVVLSTLHTNDAAGVLERLSDMGIEPYFTAAALNGVISQRLVRRICGECAIDAKLTPAQAAFLSIPENTPVREAPGCPHCNQTGFLSRLAIYEYIIFTEENRRHLVANPARFAAEIRKRGNMKKNALRSLTGGLTTADELIGVLDADEF